MNIGKKLWQLAARYVALPVIRSYASKYGSLTRFYNDEVERVGKSDEREQISSLVSVYELESETYGFSPSVKSLEDAVSFGLLSPLEFVQSEFNDIAEGIKQNKRRASVFIEEDGTLRDIDAFSIKEVFALDFPKSNLLVDLPDTNNKIRSFVFFYDDKSKEPHWWVASSGAVFTNTHKYMGVTFEIPAIRVNNKETEDFYYIAYESKVPDEFFLRFRFVNALNDALLTDSEKTMISEDLAFISNNNLERYLNYAFGEGCEMEDDDEPEDFGYFNEENSEFIMDDMVDDAVVMKLVNMLLDEGYDEEFIHVTLDKSNKCERLVVDCPDGTQYDTIKDILQKLGIKS